MRFSLDWLREFVEVDLEPERLAERLSVSGFEVGSWEIFRDPADPAAAPDAVFEIDITANRPDTMNHFGLAREIAAILGLPVKPPSFELREEAEPAAGAARVEIEAWDLCPRYVGRVVKGLRIDESPAWLRRRLAAIGVGSKNNVVDASNYVLFELGQPLHAFDLRTLSGRGVIVRRAREGERIVTVVDHEDKSLAGGTLVIGEIGESGRPGPPAAIAGVMGGLATAITDRTTDVLVESAWFDPRSVRRTARMLAIHSDASHRFERGADPGMTAFAADRLAALMVKLGGGRLLAGALDPRPADTSTSSSKVAGFRPAPESKTAPAAPGGAIERRFDVQYRDEPVRLRPARLEAVLGIAAGRTAIAAVLERLSILTVAAGAPDDTLACRVPTWRGDVAREIDLIEEYARLTGYAAVPETLPLMAAASPLACEEGIEDRARHLLAALGYREAINYAMVGKGDDMLFGPLPSASRAAGEPGERLVITNPLSERWEVMRRSLLPGLARTLTFNLARGCMDIRIFEVATVHARGTDGSARERFAAAIGGAGFAADPGWPTSARSYDLLDIKGAIEILVEALTGGSLARKPANHDGSLAFSPPGDAATTGTWPFHPRQSFLISLGGRPIGRGGRLTADIERALECDRPLHAAEIDLDPLVATLQPPQFRPLPRLNPVERDLSFFVDRRVPFATIERTVGDAASSLLAGDTGAPAAVLVDRFEGGPVPAGKVSYAFRFRFIQRERALTAVELNAAVESIARSLVAGVDAEIRTR